MFGSRALQRLRPLAAGLGLGGGAGLACFARPARASDDDSQGRWAWAPTPGPAAAEEKEATGGGKSYQEWVDNENTIRIPLETLVAEYVRVLTKMGVPADRAAIVAGLLGDNQRDGVYSHGLNRFGNFYTSIGPDAEGERIDVTATPEKVAGFGMMEQWDGARARPPSGFHPALPV